MRGTPAFYFQSLNREFHVLGVNRELFFLFVGMCLPIAFSSRLSPLMDIIAFLIFIVLYVIGVLLTRADNQILIIYRRHIHFKKYYSPQALIHSKISAIKPSVPFYVGKRGFL